jgi:hypothetical protein
MFSFGTYSWSSVIEQSSSKVLGDKTPFHHNRQDPLFTPAPQTFKIVKFALEEDEPELVWPSTTAPASALLRPSSARKSLRGRLSGGDGDKERREERFGPLGLKGLQLQTPMNPKNRHWDVGDLDLEAPAQTEPIAEEEEEDDDEIEYMPPKVGEFVVPMSCTHGWTLSVLVQRSRTSLPSTLRCRTIRHWERS